MKNISEIKDRILTALKNDFGTAYFTVYSVKGQEITIRVGDHSANKVNNKGKKTLSFISNRSTQRKSAHNKMIDEWAVDLDTELTDTFQKIEEVLEWEDVAADQAVAEELFYDN